MRGSVTGRVWLDVITVLFLLQASWCLADTVGQSLTPWVNLDSKFYFSPHGGCPQAILERIAASSRTIDMAAFALADCGVALALAAAAGRGVAIRIVGNKGSNCPTPKVAEVLAGAGLQVHKKKTTGLLHDKYLIIDAEYVVTGSFNFTDNADTKNRENLAVMKGAPVARIYQADFMKLWDLPDFQPPPGPPVNAFVARMKRELARWVKQGVITQEQADQILAGYAAAPEESGPAS